MFKCASCRRELPESKLGDYGRCDDCTDERLTERELDDQYEQELFESRVIWAISRE
jgi:DNA-directed RNA polymerase subunit RPC12/RpoP